MKVLLTGGAGYIGSVLSNILIKNKIKVYIVDNLSTGYSLNINKKAFFYKKDIRDEMFLTKLLKKEKIKNVIHLAASMSNDDSIRYPSKYYMNNIYGTYKLINACENSEVNNIIFSSSCAVYGKNLTKKISENHPKNPVAPYGLTKLIGERLIIERAKKKFNYAILRYFNVVGADLKNKNGQIYKNNQLFQNIALSMLNQKTLSIYGNKFKTKDGYAVRDFIDVNDLAYLHFRFLNNLKTNKNNYIINCGYGKGSTVKEIIDHFQSFSKAKLKYEIKPSRQGDIPFSVCNNAKLNTKINWKPRFNDVRKSIKNTIHWNQYLVNKL